MGLVEKLEKRAKEIDPQWEYGYNLRAADDRELLEQAAKRVRELEAPILARIRHNKSCYVGVTKLP